MRELGSNIVAMPYVDSQTALGAHLGIEDPELIISLGYLSAKIDAHFKKFRLVAEPNIRLQVPANGLE